MNCSPFVVLGRGFYSEVLHFFYDDFGRMLGLDGHILYSALWCCLQEDGQDLPLIEH
ncbi:MAG: hypothetical protein QXO32_06800 [Candidatus Bathyarchaeia archaeon]